MRDFKGGSEALSPAPPRHLVRPRIPARLRVSRLLLALMLKNGEAGMQISAHSPSEQPLFHASSPMSTLVSPLSVRCRARRRRARAVNAARPVLGPFSGKGPSTGTLRYHTMQ